MGRFWRAFAWNATFRNSCQNFAHSGIEYNCSSTLCPSDSLSGSKSTTIWRYTIPECWRLVFWPFFKKIESIYRRPRVESFAARGRECTAISRRFAISSRRFALSNWSGSLSCWKFILSCWQYWKWPTIQPTRKLPALSTTRKEGKGLYFDVKIWIKLKYSQFLSHN